MKRTLALVGAALAVAGLSGCAGVDRTTVRPLVADDVGAQALTSYDAETIQKLMTSYAAQLSTSASQQGGWGTLDRDAINEDILETVFIEPDRPPVQFMGGTEASSLLIGKNQVIFTMSGDNGACWAVRLSGDPRQATVEKAGFFSPSCEANKALDDAVHWATGWPSAAPEPGKGDPTVGPDSPQGPAPISDPDASSSPSPTPTR